jgi:creatinine amidohydrolase/Fe(II)-dependent formamide hydrolase-like protein
MGSDPALATVEKGAELVALAASGLVKTVTNFSNEAKP